MTEDFVRDVHNLLAEIRGVATSLTIGGPGAFARNFELSVGAFSRGPDLAVGMAALISVRRFEQLNDARIAGAREVMVFPKEELLRSFRLRKGAVPDCLHLVEQIIDHGMTDGAPVRDLVKRHGVPGFMMLLQIYNKIGEMLVEADPTLSSLDDLMTREALADESDWFSSNL
ncbi:hypothetical protein ACJ5H2_04925 [Nocardioides sp. R1-1]|uniref:hypothetical protein n=1 Tax=Nocardioides sp. R1-1 TaxID=3383502 RepID=UPI0038D08DA1